METRYLRSLLKIAETGSITRAADSLGISQPSLSQQLLRLEDEVGVALFARTARGVTLTDSGLRFLAQARHILESVNAAVEDARQFGAEPVGEVILALPYSVSRIAGAALFAAMEQRAPKVRLRLVEAMTAQIWGWIEEGKVDLGIVNYLGHRRDLTFRALASEELFLVGPAGEFGNLDAMPAIAFADLPARPLILPGLPHGLRQLIDQEAARHGVALQVYRDLDALSLLPGLLAGGRGYAICPASTVAAELAAGQLSLARIGDGTWRRRLALVRNSAAVVTHASVLCETVLAQVAERLIAEGVWAAPLEHDLEQG